jgi:tetratricopeptide (TPR) repeat protein
MSASTVSAQPTPKNQVQASQTKVPIGQLLVKAGLISENQLNLALQNQAIPGYEDLRLGEILALRGWVKQETVDFFAARWEQLLSSVQMTGHHQKIGDYLADAQLLTQEQVVAILQAQQEQPNLFGQLAVAQGYLKQQTVDFFADNLLTKKPQKNHTDNRVELCLTRAERYAKLGDMQGAILELREVLHLDANNCHAHARLTMIYLEQSQPSLAKVHLKQAIAANQNDRLVREAKKRFFAAIPAKVQQPKPVQTSAVPRRNWLKFG